jgi:hypothetical protein
MNCHETCELACEGCPVQKCKFWIDYPEEFNCSKISVEKNGAMTLRETAKRLGISYVRVKQLEDEALEALSTIEDKR